MTKPREYTQAIIISLMLFAITFISTDFVIGAERVIKWYFFIIFSCLLLPFYLVSLYKQKVFVTRINGQTLSVALLWIYLIIRLFNSNTINIFLLSIIVSSFFIYLFFIGIHKDRLVICINKIIGITTSILIVVGFFQYFGYLPNNSQFEIVGFFDNPIGFASCVAVGFPFYFCLLPERRKYIYITTAFLLTLTVLVLSGSRTGVLAVIIPLLIFIYSKNENILKDKLKFPRFILATFIFGIVFSIAFLIKTPSTQGRLLIWKSSLSECQDNILFGSGPDSFLAEYMPAQAGYLANSYVDTSYEQIADNVQYPFNEFIGVIFEYGIIGVFLSLCIIFFSFWRTKQLTVYHYSLIAILVCSLFSYPFRYPLVVFILLYNLAMISKNAFTFTIKAFQFPGKASLLLILNMLATLYWTGKDFIFEYRWCKIAGSKIDDKILNEYNALYRKWNGNPLFIYNYGALLLKEGLHRESIEVLEPALKYINDYDMQIVLGENHLHIKDYKKAERHFILASKMCPNRYVPLKRLVNIYDEIDCIFKADSIAKVIIDKEVKIPSDIVASIKLEMMKRVNYNGQR